MVAYEWAAKSVRTIVQVIAAGVATAALKHFAGSALTSTEALPVLGGLTWATSTAQNLLEDNGVVGTWLRGTTLTAAGAQRVAAKAAAQVQRAADLEAEKMRRLTPLAAALQPQVDIAIRAALSSVTNVIAETAPAPTKVVPSVASPSESTRNAPSEASAVVVAPAGSAWNGASTVVDPSTGLALPAAKP